MWLTVVVVILVALAVCVACAVVYGASRWKAGTRKLRARLEAARLPINPLTYNPREIEGLPPPVERYFRAALKDGQPIVAAVRVSHEGQFNMGEAKEKWRPFTSNQVVITHRPGFDWDGRIAMKAGRKRVRA